jgi:hypothetical protein
MVVDIAAKLREGWGHVVREKGMGASVHGLRVRPKKKVTMSVALPCDSLRRPSSWTACGRCPVRAASRRVAQGRGCLKGWGGGEGERERERTEKVECSIACDLFPWC